MTTSIVVLIVVIVVLLAIIAVLGITMASRRKRLRERFGPEYDRLVTQSDSRRLAEAELTERERRVRKLDLQELSDSARQRYLSQWAAVQEQFVDDPAAAVVDGQQLVEAVMRDRGYPVAEFHQTLADLSVEHAQRLDHVRQAHEISQKAAAGQASTEELRIAMLHYRELFSDLLGDPAAATSPATATSGPTVLPETADDESFDRPDDDDLALDESGTARRARR
jgi:hypothetical protein